MRANFTLQLHGWGRISDPSEHSFISSKDVLEFPDKGRWHYDLRIRPEGKAYWIGWTITSKLSNLFKNKSLLAYIKQIPTTQGSYVELPPPGYKSSLSWMLFEGVIPPDYEANLAKQWAEMWIIDKGIAVFEIITDSLVEAEFEGKVLRGRFHFKEAGVSKSPEGYKASKWIISKMEIQEKMITTFLGKPILEIEGWASTIDRDVQGDVVLPSAFSNSLERFMKDPKLYLKHKDFVLAGHVVEAKIKPQGLWIKAIVTSPLAAYLITKAGYQGLSCGWIPLKKDSLGRLTEVELLEISITNYPANRNALIHKIKVLDKEALDTAVEYYGEPLVDWRGNIRSHIAQRMGMQIQP